jgi:hypothetical protein
MSHVSSCKQSLAQCLNFLHLKHATGVRRSSNGDTIIPPSSSVTLSDLSSFSASSFVATLTTTDACCPLGLGRSSYHIVHTFTSFSVSKRSIADLLTFPLSMSIARKTSIQSALTAYYLSPTSLAPEMCSFSHSAVVYWKAAL